MSPSSSDRRRFIFRGLRQGVGVAGAVAAPALLLPARAASREPRSLSLVHTHTGEDLSLVYAVGDRYDPSALDTLNRFLRDHYTGQVGRIDPQLHDQLHALRQELGTQLAFHVISGYRCPATNDRLRRTRGGGVARRSLHMDGRAIDVRLPGVPLATLRDAAWSRQAGGVGYYPDSRFVHVDTGRVRRW
jgi:uncharacterized protein YcbK (DUF882 family)